MAKSSKPAQKTSESKRRTASSTEARNNQCVSLAIDLALQQLRDGTATSQVICHFLKLGTEQAKLDLEKTKRENKLLEAKAESIESGKRLEELYSGAIAAMRSYQGAISNSDVDIEIEF